MQLKTKKIIGAFSIILMTGIAIGQNANKCGFPIHVPADSLFNYVLKENNIKADDLKNLTDYFDLKNAYKLDTVYAQSQDYLIDKLGMDNYCKYVSLKPESFHHRKYPDYGMEDSRLDYFIDLPGLHGKGKAGQMKIQFIFVMKQGMQATFAHDRELPDCKELFKKGFAIDKQKAIEIAKKNDFIHEGDHYTIELIIFDWVLTKFIKEKAQNQVVKINAQTGLQSEPRIVPLVY